MAKQILFSEDARKANGHDRDPAGAAVEAADPDPGADALGHLLHMRDHADLAPERLQAIERVERDIERFGVQAAEALVDEQRLDLDPVRRQ